MTLSLASSPTYWAKKGGQLTPEEGDNNIAYLVQHGMGTNTVSLSALGILSDADLAIESSTFGTDQTEAIQAILDLAKTKPMRFIWDVKASHRGVVWHDYSTFIFLEGCGMILRDNSDAAIFANANWQQGLGGTYNADGSFTRVIVNRHLRVLGGIFNGNGRRNGQWMQTHSSDENGFTVGIKLWSVDNYHVRGLEIRNTRTYGFESHTCQNSTEYDCLIDQGPNATVNMDGRDANGSQHNIRSYGWKIIAADDAHCYNSATCLNGADAGKYGRYKGKGGPVTDCQNGNIELAGDLGVAIRSGTHRVDNVTYDNVYGTSKYYCGVVDNYWQKPYLFDSAGAGNIGTVVFNNFRVKCGDPRPFGGLFANFGIACNVERAIFRDWQRTDFSQDGQSTIVVYGPNTVVGILEVESYYALGNPKSLLAHILISGAHVETLIFRGVNITHAVSDESMLYECVNGGSVGNVILEDINTKNLGYLAFIQGTVNSIKADMINQTNGSASFRVDGTGTVNDLYLGEGWNGPLQTMETNGGVITTKRGRGLLVGVNGSAAATGNGNAPAGSSFSWKLNEQSGTRKATTGNKDLAPTGTVGGDGTYAVFSSQGTLQNSSIPNLVGAFEIDLFVKGTVTPQGVQVLLGYGNADHTVKAFNLLYNPDDQNSLAIGLKLGGSDSFIKIPNAAIYDDVDHKIRIKYYVPQQQLGLKIDDLQEVYGAEGVVLPTSNSFIFSVGGTPNGSYAANIKIRDLAITTP